MQRWRKSGQPGGACVNELAAAVLVFWFRKVMQPLFAFALLDQVWLCELAPY